MELNSWRWKDSVNSRDCREEWGSRGTGAEQQNGLIKDLCRLDRNPANMQCGETATFNTQALLLLFLKGIWYRKEEWEVKTIQNSFSASEKTLACNKSRLFLFLLNSVLSPPENCWEREWNYSADERAICKLIQKKISWSRKELSRALHCKGTNQLPLLIKAGMEIWMQF